MNFTSKTENTCTTFFIEGRLDTLSVPPLEQAVAEKMKPGVSMVFDCAQMEYISSAGMRLLLGTHKKLAKEGGLTVLHLNEMVREIIDLSGFNSILNIQ